VQDGYKPYAGLVYDPETGFLYGTTELGGAPIGSGLQGCGTIYQFDPNTLTEKILYSFSGGTYGCMSHAPLIIVNGILYGTTSGMSADQSVPSMSGTVFGFNIATNKLEYNYAFKGGLADGSNSQAPVVYDQAHNMLYGTTTNGGPAYNVATGQRGYGTIFQVDLSGSGFSEKPIYFFTGGNDGMYPLTGLAYDGISTYYTTTSMGPIVTNKDGSTVTEGGVLVGGTLAPVSGVVLHTFTGTNGDGYQPNGGLIFENGALYGTTYQGGGATDCTNGCGTVFKYVP
jgi:uncharacterized repeat protein (TIGR03803 family)